MIASTRIQIMKALVSSRSHTPTHGVGELLCSAGAYVPAQAPQANTIAIVASEYRRKRFTGAAEPYYGAECLASAALP